jgi:hypothetical protein
MMFWRGDLSDVQKTIRDAVKESVAAEMAPMRERVSQLTESTKATSAKMEAMMMDHATRADLEKLRSEMQTGFSTMGSTYMPKVLSDQRYEELKSIHDSLRKQVEEIKNRGWTLGSNAVAWVIAGMGVLVAIIAILHK